MSAQRIKYHDPAATGATPLPGGSDKATKKASGAERDVKGVGPRFTPCFELSLNVFSFVIRRGSGVALWDRGSARSFVAPQYRSE
jgi:hypothetical protein